MNERKSEKLQHPGEIIKGTIKAIPMSVKDFAKHIDTSRVRLSRILNTRDRVTPKISIKISQAFGQKQGDHWFRLQNEYDFSRAERSAKKRKKIKPIGRQRATKR